jgi:TonB family protein
VVQIIHRLSFTFTTMVFLLKLTVCWGFFALLYSLLLRRETFFRANRIYLLGTLAAGVVLAACDDLLWAPVAETGLQEMVMPVVQVGLQQAAEASRQWKGADYARLIYLLGVMWMLLRTAWGVSRLIRMARRGTPEPLPGGITLIHSAEIATSFSFFKWIFVPAETRADLSEYGTKYILAHERAHAEGWHSLDVMLLELVCALCWFHPLAYWYRRSLRTVHEYLADARASRLTDKKQYGLLLIRQSQSGMPVAFANHFFQSPLKQRLIMLMKKHSAPVRAFRYALVLPLALLFLLLFQKAPAIAQEATAAYSGSTPDQMTFGVRVDAPQTFLSPTNCDVAPAFPGGMEAMFDFFSKNLQYPAPVDGKLKEGVVAVSFMVKEDGYIKDVHLSEPDGDRMPATYEAEALRVVSMLPKWTPGKKNCKPAAFELCIPIKFKADFPKTAAATPESTVELFDVEKPPVFPGGDAALMKYLVENIKLSESDKKTAPGVMAFRFVVSQDGSVSKVEMIKDGGVSLATQEHVMQVIKTMPAWTPAQKAGKPVGVYFTLPIRIALN